MDKTLVTGGHGLVGSQFTGEQFLKVKSSDCDLRHQESIKRFFSKNKFNNVIHCAAKVGGLGSNMNFKGEYFYDNIMINTNIIEMSRLFNVKKLVCFLSTCVFPDNVEYPLTEKKIHLGEPHYSNYSYAYAKRMADIQIRSYREQYGLNYVSVIPTNIYGTNDNFSLTHGHVIPMLIHKLYLAQRDKTEFVVWGSGNPLREFIFSEDVADLTKWVLNNYNDVDPIILSNSQEIKIKDIVDILISEFNFKGKVIFDKTKSDGQMRKPSDNSKLKSLVPDYEFTPIEIGIKKTVEWFLKNYEKVRK